MDSKPRKTRKDKGVKRKGKGKGKKIARGAKKLFETDLLAIQRRPAQPRVAQQQQPVFNLNISQNLRNIVGAFASAATAANYAKTQEINRQAADASYRAETIVGLSRENFLQNLEKQRLERKVERGERAYAAGAAQAERKIRDLGTTIFSLIQNPLPAIPRRELDITSMSESGSESGGERRRYPVIVEGFDDVPPSRQLSASDLGIISRPISRVPSAEMASPLAVFTPRRSLQEIAADERALRGESEGYEGGFGGSAAYGGGAAFGGGSAYASEQYLQNQPRGRPVIADPATARSERVNKKIAKIIRVKEPKPREELQMAREDADAAIAAARARKAQASASAEVPIVTTGGVAVAGGGDAAPRPKLKLKLKPETIARLAAEAAAAAAEAAPSGGETTESESSDSMGGAVGGGAAASAPQKLRAAEIRSQLSAAAGITQKSIKFGKGKGSRKAVEAVDWVAEIAEIRKRGLSGAEAIAYLKEKHAGVLE